MSYWISAPEKSKPPRNIFCKIQMHKRPEELWYVEDGTWPWPVYFNCERCGLRCMDPGPEH